MSFASNIHPSLWVWRISEPPIPKEDAAEEQKKWRSNTIKTCKRWARVG